MLRGVLALRPYQLGDIDAVEATADFVAERAGQPAPLGFAWTITRGEVPIACAGARHDRPGVFEVWSYLAPLTMREWVFASRSTVKVMDFIIRTLGAQRFVAYAGTAPGVAFLERLGFSEVDLFIEPGGDPLHLMERKVSCPS